MPPTRIRDRRRRGRGRRCARIRFAFNGGRRRRRLWPRSTGEVHRGKGRRCGSGPSRSASPRGGRKLGGSTAPAAALGAAGAGRFPRGRVGLAGSGVAEISRRHDSGEGKKRHGKRGARVSTCRGPNPTRCRPKALRRRLGGARFFKHGRRRRRSRDGFHDAQVFQKRAGRGGGFASEAGKRGQIGEHRAVDRRGRPETPFTRGSEARRIPRRDRRAGECGSGGVAERGEKVATSSRSGRESASRSAALSGRV
mmetsp:Transcript_16735/g.59384  ORF Transcript_16735/g.59384 Transcript_16735/m.59384 type:complete len:253 (+) Transcript_16735:1749-2507(+)